MSLNFSENNIGFYTGTLKICKKTLQKGHCTNLMQLTHLLVNVFGVLPLLKKDSSPQ